MKRIQFPVYFTEEEHEDFKDLARERRTPLVQLIRDLLYSYKANPAILNPIKDQTDIDVLLNALEISANERKQHNQKFESMIISSLNILDRKVNELMKKAKFPKKMIEELEGKDVSGERIFE